VTTQARETPVSKTERPSRYLMEHSGEGDRLERKTDAAASRHQLLRAGLKESMTALDAGAGTGAVGRVMADIVGSTGVAIALDRSPQRLGFAPTRQSRVVGLAGDVSQPPLANGSIDFVWARFLLEYAPDPLCWVRSLAQLLKQDGSLVLVDLDHAGTNLWPCPPEIDEGLATILSRLQGFWDPHVGRKLPALVREAGLSVADLTVEPYHCYLGDADVDAVANWRTKLETIGPFVEDAFAPGQYQELAEKYLNALTDGNTFFYSTMITVVAHHG
jgi:SAM-dependent methyltransferase